MFYRRQLIDIRKLGDFWKVGWILPTSVMKMSSWTGNLRVLDWLALHFVCCMKSHCWWAQNMCRKTHPWIIAYWCLRLTCLRDFHLWPFCFWQQNDWHNSEVSLARNVRHQVFGWLSKRAFSGSGSGKRRFLLSFWRLAEPGKTAHIWKPLSTKMVSEIRASEDPANSYRFRSARCQVERIHQVDLTHFSEVL